MKFWKVFLLSAFTVGLSTLSSCGKDENKTTISLDLWTYYNGTIESSFQDMIKEFNETSGAKNKIVVSALSQGSSVNDLNNALVDSATKKQGASKMPDMFISYADCCFKLDSLGMVANLDDYFSKDYLNNFNQDFINEGRIGKNNELKILPVSKSTEALYINKTDFDKFIESETDVSYNDLKTIEGIIKVAEKYYNKTGKAFFGRDSIDNYFVVGAKQLGIDILHYDDDDNFEINFVRDKFKKLWDSYYVPYVKGYFASIGKYRSNDVQSGEILCYIGSTSSGGYFPKNVVLSKTESYNIDCEIMTTPVFTDGQKVAVSQGAGFCVTKSTKEKEMACVEFLKWLCEKQNIVKFAETSGYFPATNDGFDNEFINSQTTYKKNFEICKQTLNEYKMYTNIVGINGNDYRNLLKNSMINACKNARAQVEEANNDEALINELTSDKAFDDWFNSLKGQVAQVY